MKFWGSQQKLRGRRESLAVPVRHLVLIAFWYPLGVLSMYHKGVVGLAGNLAAT